MYAKKYGIIETLAPLHVGATAGEESGNLNLIFRDQFTQTGIIPGSSMRGRLRADMRINKQKWLYKKLKENEVEIISDLELQEQNKKNNTNTTRLEWMIQKATENNINIPEKLNEKFWYGHADEPSCVKMEYASIVWLPVFAPGQPIIWVSCPRLLRRYQRIVGDRLANKTPPSEYTSSKALKNKKSVFFNFGFVKIKKGARNLSDWFPLKQFADGRDANDLPAVIVADNEMAAIHDMALYRQSRVALAEKQKIVAGGAFFNVEALPEGTILAFPVGVKKSEDGSSALDWKPFASPDDGNEGELYLGGLESVGFGHCYLRIEQN